MTKQKNDYPLREHTADDLRAISGRRLADVTLAAAAAGELGIADLQVDAATLRAQAAIALEAGYPQLADNLNRAAELAAVPNAEVLKMYELLRPGRADYAELIGMAEALERDYRAIACAALVRGAAEVYQKRALLRR